MEEFKIYVMTFLMQLTWKKKQMRFNNSSIHADNHWLKKTKFILKGRFLDIVWKKIRIWDMADFADKWTEQSY